MVISIFLRFYKSLALSFALKLQGQEEAKPCRSRPRTWPGLQPYQGPGQRLSCCL